MEQLKIRLHSCQRALATLSEVLDMPSSVIVRDASIQRFEYSFESVWKLLKAYLSQHEGILCNSPKQCFREALQIGMLSVEETETCLVMTDSRNLTSHTYVEGIADQIYSHLASYLDVMNSLWQRINQRVGEIE